jgi:hypothetical protein
MGLDKQLDGIRAPSYVRSVGRSSRIATKVSFYFSFGIALGRRLGPMRMQVVFYNRLPDL